MKKPLLAVTASFAMLSALMLGACSNNEGTNEAAEPTAAATATVPANEATATPEPTGFPEGSGGQETPPPSENEPQASERPVTQEFGGQEGGIPGQTGTLAKGTDYSLYIFDGFALVAESSRLTLAEDPAYYAEIEPLPTGYDLATLKQQGQSELSAIGETNEYSGELIEHPLGYAELYLQASGDEGLVDYMVWKNQTGDAYLFRIHNPKGERSSDFATWVMVSLATTEANE